MELLPPVLQHQARVGCLPRKLRRLTRHSHPARPLPYTARVAKNCYRPCPNEPLADHHAAHFHHPTVLPPTLSFSAGTRTRTLGLLSQSTALHRSVNVHQYVRDQSNLSVPRCQPLRPNRRTMSFSGCSLSAEQQRHHPSARHTARVLRGRMRRLLVTQDGSPHVIGLPIRPSTVRHEKRNDEVQPEWFSFSARRRGVRRPASSAAPRKAGTASNAPPRNSDIFFGVAQGTNTPLTKMCEAKGTKHTKRMTHHVVPHRRHGRPGSSSWYPLCHRREVQHHTCAVVQHNVRQLPCIEGWGIEHQRHAIPAFLKGYPAHSPAPTQGASDGLLTSLCYRPGHRCVSWKRTLQATTQGRLE